MIDKLMFVQSNKATDHSMAYADLDSSNVNLHVWASGVLGGLHLSYPHSMQARFSLQPVTSSRDGIRAFSIQPECPDIKNQQRLSTLEYVVFLTFYQSFPNIAFR